jgi:hypothetical protein
MAFPLFYFQKRWGEETAREGVPKARNVSREAIWDSR